MESLRGIGRMSRESGLTVSALRFYDGAGVLSPARVDPDTGYRFYAPDQLAVARLVGTLRRVGMPLAGIRVVLEHRHDPDAVDALLAGHVERLERGLADARRMLSAVRSQLGAQETPMIPTTVTLAGEDLARALRAVRFAVGSDPELPVLGGILLDLTADDVTAVATDRYRLALASAPLAASEGPAVGVVVAAAFADRILELADGPVTTTVDGGAVTVRSAAGEATGVALDAEFPDYRALLPDGRAGIPVDPQQVRAAVAGAGTRRMARAQDGAEHDVVVVAAGPDGGLVVGAPDGIGVNAEFLLEALDAGGPGPLHLRLDGPITPLVVRSAASLSLLMPVRLEPEAASVP